MLVAKGGIGGIENREIGIKFKRKIEISVTELHQDTLLEQHPVNNKIQFLLLK